MTIEQVKEEVKKHFNKEISDEQAQAWLDSHRVGELADDELKNVAGGGCDSGYVCPRCGSKNISGYINMAKDEWDDWMTCLDCGCIF